jgi:abortive infection bacteriophage resistance protein
LSGVMVFPKNSTTIQEQTELWRKRGLVIGDNAAAGHYLKFIGYYRLSAYALVFQDANPLSSANGLDKPFSAGTTFDDVLKLYVFDRELRLLVMDAIERIEVAFRICIMNTMCVKYGPHWFMDKSLFYPEPHFSHDRFVRKIEEELKISKSGRKPDGDHNETCINHYYKKYGEPYLPPAWMVVEIMPIGVWSRVFAGLKQERKAIAAHFLIDESVLKDWLHTITYVRNLCAHHSRLWNRRFVIKLARKHSKDTSSGEQFYSAFLVIRDLVEKIAPNTTWALNFAALLKQHPKVPVLRMGFPSGWTLI